VQRGLVATILQRFLQKASRSLLLLPATAHRLPMPIPCPREPAEYVSVLPSPSCLHPACPFADGYLETTAAPVQGYTLRGLKLMNVPKQLAETHYADLSSKPFFGGEPTCLPCLPACLACLPACLPACLLLQHHTPMPGRAVSWLQQSCQVALVGWPS